VIPDLLRKSVIEQGHPDRFNLRLRDCSFLIAPWRHPLEFAEHLTDLGFRILAERLPILLELDAQGRVLGAQFKDE